MGCLRGEEGFPRAVAGGAEALMALLGPRQRAILPSEEDWAGRRSSTNLLDVGLVVGELLAGHR